ncbi:hypothetical protein ACSS6W_007918 [Trichoderma asperelloides]
MRFILLAALIAPFASAAVAGVDVEARAEVEAIAQVEERSLLPLDKRSCVANGCKCSTKHPLKQGQYCGNCVWSNGDGYIITAKRDPAATMAWVVIVVLALLAADKGSQIGQRLLDTWRKETVNRRCIKRRIHL